MCSREFSAPCTTKTAPSTLPGFYDGVEELPEEIKEQWDALDFDAGVFLGDVGLTTPAGERAARRSNRSGPARPATSTGSSAAIPARAPKQCCRPRRAQRCRSGWSASKIRKGRPVVSRLRHVAPAADVKAEFIDHAGSPAITLPIKNEALRRARRALEAEWGKPAALVGCGGSIPIVGAFKRELNMDSLLVGFALEDDNIHSPNEKYERARSTRARGPGRAFSRPWPPERPPTCAASLAAGATRHDGRPPRSGATNSSWRSGGRPR